MSPKIDGEMLEEVEQCIFGRILLLWLYVLCKHNARALLQDKDNVWQDTGQDLINTFIIIIITQTEVSNSGQIKTNWHKMKTKQEKHHFCS